MINSRPGADLLRPGRLESAAERCSAAQRYLAGAFPLAHELLEPEVFLGARRHAFPQVHADATSSARRLDFFGRFGRCAQYIADEERDDEGCDDDDAASRANFFMIILREREPLCIRHLTAAHFRRETLTDPRLPEQDSTSGAMPAACSAEKLKPHDMAIVGPPIGTMKKWAKPPGPGTSPAQAEVPVLALHPLPEAATTIGTSSRGRKRGRWIADFQTLDRAARSGASGAEVTPAIAVIDAQRGFDRPPRLRSRQPGSLPKLGTQSTLAGEVHSTDAACGRTTRPPVGGTLELAVPVVRAGEPAVHHAHHAIPPPRASTIHSVATFSPSSSASVA